MKAPAWVRRALFGPPVHTAAGVGHVVVTLEVDTTAYVRAMADTARAAKTTAEAFDALGRAAHATANAANQWMADRLQSRKVLNARLIARMETAWYVRGGQDLTYAQPEARDRQVRWIIRESGMDPHLASVAAAAFLRGWVTHQAPLCERACEYALDVAPEYAPINPSPYALGDMEEVYAAARRRACGACEHYLGKGPGR